MKVEERLWSDRTDCPVWVYPRRQVIEPKRVLSRVFIAAWKKKMCDGLEFVLSFLFLAVTFLSLLVVQYQCDSVIRMGLPIDY